MDWLPPLLPITVIAAVLLFFLKELLEWTRRRRADAREARAFRVLLARECELNYWAYSRLKQTLRTIKSGLAHDESENFAISKGDYTGIRFEHNLNDNSRGSWPLPDFHTEVMDKIVLDVATLDKALYSNLEQAYGAVANLKHVRQSLIAFVSSEDDQDKAHLEAFPEYGLRELSRALADLKALYRTCTGTDKIPSRLR